MSTAASLEYPAGVILLSFPLTLYTLALPFAKRYCERVSQSILFPQRYKKTTTNGRAEIELVPDAWPRFEKFIREIVKTGPILPISHHIFGFGNRWNSQGISEG
jgi:hypothetical protein